ncbi:MAG: transglycosylase SLT domain-containing protein [Dysgonamonadaceae bacterium]|jgi:membrane-bound lytic murein transglycosylase F|nr:transglycosylase SLT domain-containing protein [Dysgonamonadaceae bacterium]
MMRNFRLCCAGFLFIGLILIVFCKPNKPDSPVRDFSQIVDSGEINVLTLSGSMSYFIYKGEKMGYQYELIKDFADANHLRLNLIPAANEIKLRKMLEEGTGDLIAYNVPVTAEGKEKFLYCGHETINEQVIVQRSDKKDTILKDVTELIGKEIWVIHNSRHYNRLINLNNELGGGINIRIVEEDTISVEDLIERVSDGKIPYTVSNWDMARLNKTYHANINISLKISHPQRSAWAVRKNTPALAQAIDEWFENKANTHKYKAVIKRYFEMSKLPGDAPAPIIGSTGISPFDTLFRQYAAQIPWDWRLMASISYEESKFYTDRVSWAGATGLMGLMPKTARSFGLEPEDALDPEASIRAATALIKRINQSFSFIRDENERIKFVVASYNAGAGHISDVMALAEKYGKNPEVWENNVEEYLKLKQLPEYYNDPVCKYGYFRGNETFSYVRAVMERWHYYREKVK